MSSTLHAGTAAPRCCFSQVHPTIFHTRSAGAEGPASPSHHDPPAVALFPSPLRCLFRAPRPCWRSAGAEELASPAAVSHSRRACLARVAPPAVICARSRRAVLRPGPRRGQAEHGRVRAPPSVSPSPLPLPSRPHRCRWPLLYFSAPCSTFGEEEKVNKDYTGCLLQNT